MMVRTIMIDDDIASHLIIEKTGPDLHLVRFLP